MPDAVVPHMNYFEFYDLPVSFNPDQQLVKQRFYALSKKYHPDFYVNESPGKQEEVLEFSTLNNKAFQVLKDPQQTLNYVLELKGELQAGENYTLPQSFLMEMMEINEGLMELEFEPDGLRSTELTSKVNNLETSLKEELHSLAAEFDNRSSSSEGALKKIKDLYYRMKYVDRIKTRLRV